MSVHGNQKRITAPEIRVRKGAEPIVALTAYSALTARYVDPHADIILVGDSLAMAEHGMNSTIGVTLDMMILHGKSVMRGSNRALVVVDLPFGYYEASPEKAFETASRVLQETGCSAVKLEGGAHMAETIGFLTARGIPVMGHVGLTPQSAMTLGGFKVQGRKESDWPKIEADAAAVADAGAFAVVLEGTVEPLAERITGSISVPTIGIGASPKCDGQVLVLEDMLGLSERVPRFVRRFGELGKAADAAIGSYAAAVRDRSFPGEEEVYR
ncbi:3-methyl-2-oxobutanoate hydroxymethyltransferase (plasmid) [Agrobacterium leguminum]|uniref:3-methyl-2-oxobutanoate hydroxymethyltransferase n=1 Tax=Agrobacterium deltaense NCPPB 1641 TaxID=1183425 RepID=A0A1S7U9L7_9HYPH|nr:MULTISPECIES: 3-methyl-2-oxobutanoate hydroxymethyltransferase [Agrobacterium]WFS70101.1 3-methyl-2-oxobutanoate hydroxymethyltransferase [Agrobacterium leguminum]CVI63509.1 3-methyl-2-oxobutanoate hydroxymethyltransferase [Agrobacterium deltaense NCPPB 1641]